MISLAHVVNPLVVKDSKSDLRYAQPVTIRSMRVARERATLAGISVKQYAAFFEEDRTALPNDFIATPILERSVLDCIRPAADADADADARKLPLLKDILDRLYASAEDADYLIYTNIDIGLWPDFYLEVARIIEEGNDAFLIGRRTLSTEFTSPDDLEMILSQDGTPQFGFSCFVFPKAHYPDFLLGDTCIGLQPVGVTLAINMIQRASSFDNFARVRLTFHLGDERAWEQTLLDLYHLHNERELDRLIHSLSREGLAPRASEVWREYQKWRTRYVIDRCPNWLERDVYRGLRKIGLGNWVASRYDKLAYGRRSVR